MGVSVLAESKSSPILLTNNDSPVGAPSVGASTVIADTRQFVINLSERRSSSSQSDWRTSAASSRASVARQLRNG